MNQQRDNTQEFNYKNGFKDCFIISPTNKGILDGLNFSVKDVINLEGHRTGFGNPLWEKTHPLAVENAVCIQQILTNGASCIGKTITGELGFGSTGANHFYGTPYNPKVPKLVPGGSSSGSAVSVASIFVQSHHRSGVGTREGRARARDG